MRETDHHHYVSTLCLPGGGILRTSVQYGLITKALTQEDISAARLDQTHQTRDVEPKKMPSVGSGTPQKTSDTFDQEHFIAEATRLLGRSDPVINNKIRAWFARTDVGVGMRNMQINMLIRNAVKKNAAKENTAKRNT